METSCPTVQTGPQEARDVTCYTSAALSQTRFSTSHGTHTCTAAGAVQDVKLLSCDAADAHQVHETHTSDVMHTNLDAQPHLGSQLCTALQLHLGADVLRGA